jgi:hypothetical protein
MKSMLDIMASRDMNDYSQVSTDDDMGFLAPEEQAFLAAGGKQRRYPRSSVVESLKSVLIIVLLMAGIVLVTITAVKQAFPTLYTQGTAAPSVKMASNPALDIMESPCGSTPQEARDRGCVFDNIVFAWLPPRCFDEDLSKSFRDIKFHFSLERNNTHPIDQDDAYTGDYEHLFVNWE